MKENPLLEKTPYWGRIYNEDKKRVCMRLEYTRARLYAEKASTIGESLLEAGTCFKEMSTSWKDLQRGRIYSEKIFWLRKRSIWGKILHRGEIYIEEDSTLGKMVHGARSYLEQNPTWSKKSH